MNPQAFKKKIFSSCLYLVLIHVCICFLTQTVTSTLGYQLSGLISQESSLIQENEKLTLEHSQKASLTAIYPLLREKQLQSISQNLDLVTKDSFALLPSN
jgi:hypothetical protein